MVAHLVEKMGVGTAEMWADVSVENWAASKVSMSVENLDWKLVAYLVVY